MKPPKDLSAVILCGGLGTRIRALFPNVPKALVPVAGRPFLVHQLEWLKGRGVKRVFLAAGHEASQLDQWLADGQAPQGIEVSILIEPKPLGTAGALRWASAQMESESFLALNGDTLLPHVDIAGLWQSPGEAALAAVVLKAQGSQGGLLLDETDRVTEFLESGRASAGTRAGADNSSWVNGGVYRISKPLLQQFPEARSLEREVFPLLAVQNKLGASRTQPPLLDMGTPQGLQRMESFLTGLSRVEQCS